MNRVRAISQIVCEEFGVRISDIYSHKRQRRIVRARMVIYWIAYRNLSLAQIGRAMSRDHSTVSYGVRRVDQLMADDIKFLWRVERLAEDFRHG